MIDEPFELAGLGQKQKKQHITDNKNTVEVKQVSNNKNQSIHYQDEFCRDDPHFNYQVVDGLAAMVQDVMKSCKGY